MDSDRCNGCKHAPSNWRDYSQLPTCTNSEFSKCAGGIWQLHNQEECTSYEAGESPVVNLDTLCSDKSNESLASSIKYCKDRLAEYTDDEREVNDACRRFTLQIEREQKELDRRCVGNH